MYSIGMASKLLGVCPKTLRRWDKQGKISCSWTLGGHRLFGYRELCCKSDGNHNIEGENGLEEEDNLQEKVALYGRVSTHNKRGGAP